MCFPHEGVKYESDADDYFYDSDIADEDESDIPDSDETDNDDKEVEIKID